MNAVKLGAEALKVRNYLKKHDVEPLKVYETSSFNISKQLWVYTFQCGFKTEEELKIFIALSKVINAGILGTV